MARLLPAGIDDERFRALEQVLESRLDGIPLAKVLVYIIDSVDASALPALAWHLGALGEAWSAATTEAERREVLRRSLKLRRLAGTPWAIKDACDAIGHPVSELQEGTLIYRDGSIKHDGFYVHGGHWAGFRVAFDLEHAPAWSALLGVIDRYKRNAATLDALFFYDGAELVLRVTEDAAFGALVVTAGGTPVAATGTSVVASTPRPWSGA